MKRRSYYAEVSDKPPVQVCKAQKQLDLLAVIRYRPLNHSMNFSRVHLYLTRGYDEAQERHRFGMKFALFCFNRKLTDMANMGILFRGKKSG